MKRLSEFLFDIFNCYKSKSVAVLIISSTRLCCETHHMCMKDCQNVAISHCLHFVVEIIVWNVHFVFVCLIYFENVNTLLFLFLEVKLYSQWRILCVFRLVILLTQIISIMFRETELIPARFQTLKSQRQVDCLININQFIYLKKYQDLPSVALL